MFRLTSITVAALATVVVAVAPAAAQHPLYPRGDVAGPPVAQDLRMPDRRDPAPVAQPWTHKDLRSADARDSRRVETVPAPPRTIVETGFDVADAAIGAGGLIALLSLASGMVLLARRHRGRDERAGVPVTAR